MRGFLDGFLGCGAFGGGAACDDDFGCSHADDMAGCFEAESCVGAGYDYCLAIEVGGWVGRGDEELAVEEVWGCDHDCGCVLSCGR